MSSWVSGGNHFTLTGIGKPRQVLHLLAHAYIGISRTETRLAMGLGPAGPPSDANELASITFFRLEAERSERLGNGQAMGLPH